MNTFAGDFPHGEAPSAERPQNIKSNEDKPRTIALTELVSALPDDTKRRIISGYDLKNFARIFEDDELMNAIKCYLECGMNISETSRKLYMHRNTLMYRMNKIRQLTGLDLRNFDMALTFEILSAFYKTERGIN